MKILLSAFACEPNAGSEPGAGWDMMLEIANRNHEIFVITRPIYKKKINKNHEILKAKNIKFYYYQLPSFWNCLLPRKSILIHYNSYIWQIGAYFLAKKLHKKESFELAHHLTYGCFRLPSLMGNLGIPLIWGPVGGGESAPLKLRKSYSIKGKITDAIRDISNYITLLDPLMWNTYYKSSQIYVTTKATRKFIPKCFHYKIQLKIQSGIDKETIVSQDAIEEIFNKDPEVNRLKLLFVGRLIHWKGVHLAVMALAKVIKLLPDTQLTLIARGKEEMILRALARKLDIEQSIIWQTGWITNEALNQAYQEHDIFIFPSLHDSGGMAPLEALAKGLPVVCLDLGGPATSVNESCGRVINTYKKSEQEVAQSMSEEIIQIWSNKSELKQISLGALDRAQDFVWQKIIDDIYKGIE